MHWTAVSAARGASRGSELAAKGTSAKKGTPHFRSASHCHGVAEHREDSCGE